MSNFDKFFKETGFPTLKGDDLLKNVKKAVEEVLSISTVENFSTTELEVLGSALNKLVSDAVSNKLQYERTVTAIEAMTDEAFENHLKNKYGYNWMGCPITDEEYSRMKPTDKERQETLQKAKDICESLRDNCTSFRVTDLLIKTNKIF